MLRARSRFRPVYWVMRPIHSAVLLVATGPVRGVSQTPPAPAPAPARPPVAAPTYRGFTPGISYRDFLERARPLADSDFVRCQTSPHTAQVMECGVVIRGPNDAARFYLSAHFIEGNADVVAFYDSAGFGDKRGVPLVDRTKKELTRLFGRPHPIGKSGWEWRYGRRARPVHLRGRGAGPWGGLTLMDKDVMDPIARYAKTAKSRQA